ncbi:SDR family NAD(P)-dependent oxidoreductase [Salinithrix halophila]|uniref:SDR family NAD(P)-dependent oxidoreductase n=1 Tax=Salinithrix halophila TaxID=1485204 RepID=A0ABV8JH34_9BACL
MSRMVLLTGASSGIGKEIARQLVRQGDFPIMAARSLPALRELRETLGQGACFSCDVTRQEDVDALKDEVLRQFGRVDALVNNAGFGHFGGALDLTLADYQEMIETNYLGAVRMTQSFLPHFLDQGGGRIVNIASTAGLTGVPNLAGYCGSKFALIGYSESLHLEFFPRIQVGVLCPGPVQTPFFRGEDPARFFPPLLARRVLDPVFVAKQAVRLLDRPRLQVMPRSLSWITRLRSFAPGWYQWAMRNMYDSLKKEKATPPCTPSWSTPPLETDGDNKSGTVSEKN